MQFKRQRRVFGVSGNAPSSVGKSHLIEPLEPRMMLSVNVTVHHGDTSNDGQNLAETVLTPSNVNAADFGKLFTTPLDGAIFAQPLYVQDVNVTRGASPGVHSVLYVATQHDSLYALDASTGAILWHDSFLNITDPTNLTATTGVTTIPYTALSSDNLGVEYGILATPAIDTSLGEIFVVTNSQEVRGADTHYVVRLWALNLSSGAAVLPPTVVGDTISDAASFFTYTGYQYVAGPIVDGTGNNPAPTVYPNTDGWVSAPGGATVPVIAFNARLQAGRTALSLMGGNIYMGFGSHGDHGPYYGWILGYSESTLAITTAFVTTPTYLDIHGDDPDATQQGSVWTSGGSFATDGTNLYITVGNGAFDTAPGNFNAQGFPIDQDYGDSVLKLTADPSSGPTKQNGNGWGLKVADYFTPSNALALEVDDLDFGSGGVLLLPNSLTDAVGNPMLMAGGKESRLYLIDRNNMGKFNVDYPTTGAADPRLYDRVLGEYPTDAVDNGTDGIYDTPSYYNGDVYVGIAHADALQFNVSTFASPTSPPGTTFVPTPVAQTPAFDYPSPTFTISANGSSNGIAWAVDEGNSDLLAFNASNISTAIYNSNTVAADQYADATKFDTPTVANGMVYVTTSNTTNEIVGFGLRSAYLATNAGYFSAPTKLSVLPVNSTNANLVWTRNSSLASEFRIDRSTNNSTWTPLAYVGNSSNSYDDTSVAANTIYYYRVVAISGATGTAPSNTAVLNPPTLPLVGTPIGTAGSYANDGDTIAKAFDGNLSTYFDGPSSTGDWVGLNLGSTFGITSISFAPRAGFTSRMVGGTFQGSNIATFASGDVNLYTVTSAPTAGVLTTVNVASPTTFQYVRYIGPNGGYSNVAEIEFFGTAPITATSPLKGTAIGTAGSYGNDGDTIAEAFDGNLSTYFDAPSASGDWAGLDLGSTYNITSISFAPRSGFTSRMVGGTFQGSDSATFTTGVVNLYTVTTAPPAGVLTTASVTAASAFRYVRYLSPAGGYCNIAEADFFGTAGAGVAPLTGTVIETAVSYQNGGNTIAEAVDGNLSTFFDAASGSGSWVARGGYASRMVGGGFQLSASADFSTGVTKIQTITASPAVASLTTMALSSPVNARYVRYPWPNGSYGAVAEIAFSG